MSSPSRGREWILGRGKTAASERARVGRIVAALDVDTPWRVEVREYRPTRTGAQNRYLWSTVYGTIAKAFDGWRLDDIHEYFLGLHFGVEEIETIAGTRTQPMRRSKRMSKLEFMDYIAHIQEVAAEHGIVIPDPEDQKLRRDDDEEGSE